jgi:hypothetical protein
MLLFSLKTGLKTHFAHFTTQQALLEHRGAG